jgi:hypothetical protein
MLPTKFSDEDKNLRCKIPGAVNTRLLIKILLPSSKKLQYVKSVVS